MYLNSAVSRTWKDDNGYVVVEVEDEDGDVGGGPKRRCADVRGSHDEAVDGCPLAVQHTGRHQPSRPPVDEERPDRRRL